MAARIGLIEKSSNLVVKRTCNLRACSIVPQPTILLTVKKEDKDEVEEESMKEEVYIKEKVSGAQFQLRPSNLLHCLGLTCCMSCHKNL
jgi:hypothetical protein